MSQETLKPASILYVGTDEDVPSRTTSLLEGVGVNADYTVYDGGEERGSDYLTDTTPSSSTETKKWRQTQER